jgi:hypothetical protein
MREVDQLRRRLGRVALIALTAFMPLLLVVAEGSARPAAAADLPPQWSTTAVADAVDVSFDTSPRLLPLDQLVHVGVPYADTAWTSSGTTTARAAVIWPGASGTGGVGLLCSFGVPCPQGFPPAYPLVAEAQSPTHEDAASQDGLATAHASGDGTRAGADGGTLVAPVLAPLSGAATVGTVHSAVSSAFHDKRLTTTADSTVHDLTLLGGVVKIRSVTATASSSAEAGGQHSSKSSVTITGVEIAGQPGQISDRGVSVANAGDGGAAAAAANQALQQALTRFHADIRLIGAVHDDSPSTSGEASGLLVHLEVPVPAPPVPGVPATLSRTYVATLVIGRARTTAFASNDGLGLDTTLASPASAIPGATGPAPTAAMAPPAASPTTPAGGQFAPSSSSSTLPSTPATASAAGFGLLTTRLSLVSIALLLAAAVLFVASRLTGPLARHIAAARRTP